jgi:predicted alpha/beta hydrolase
MVQSATDIFVGWGSLGARDYYVRQYRDMKIIPKTDLIAPVFVPFATACGKTLARAHARSGDPVAIDAYMGKDDSFTTAMRHFATLYADQNERDHARLVSAIRRGMVEGELTDQMT